VTVSFFAEKDGSITWIDPKTGVVISKTPIVQGISSIITPPFTIDISYIVEY
jgi:hypothetical protein